MFGQILKLLREKNGLTQQNLADILHIDRSSIGKYESGNTIPSVDILTKLSSHFDVSLDYLITGKEPTNYVNINKVDSNNGFIGNSHAPLQIQSCIDLSEQEQELLRVYSVIDVKKKTQLLTYAYMLEEETS